MNYWDETPISSEPYEKIAIEKLKIGLSQTLNKSMLVDGRFDIIDRSLHHLEMVVRGSVWKLGEKGEITIQYPADWWQSFKERWFPGWALTRWPVLYSVHTLTAEMIFPEASKYINLEAGLGQHYLAIFRNDYTSAR